jgi:Sulfotransferase family
MSTESPSGRAPDFFCIGAQKCGTTWLHQNLSAHPAVWLPPIKELQYFNQIHIAGHVQWTERHRRERADQRLNAYRRRRRRDPNSNFLQLLEKLASPTVDDAWYLSIFAHAPTDAICGEITPEYSLLPEAGITHLKTLSTDARIIFLWRDPIDRAWSQIRMHMLRSPGSDPLSIAASADVIRRSDYGSILRRWRRQFEESRMLVASLDSIAADPANVLSNVCAFLGLSFDRGSFLHIDAPVHQGIEIDMPDRVRMFLKERMEPIYDVLAHDFPEEAARWRVRHY